MSWVVGYLARASESNRLALVALGQETSFHCGQRLELRLDGQWERGWIEYSDSLGWYFTNSRQNLRLATGDCVRVWDGREWPRVVDNRR